MAGDMGEVETTVYASELPGKFEDYFSKVTAFKNMSSIAEKGRNLHNKNPKLTNANIPYTDLTDEELLDGIIGASLYILSEKYKITPSMFIDSSDEYLPHNMDHFENEIVDAINELSQEIGPYDVHNAPLFALLVSETLKRYADDISIRDQLLKE